MEYSSKSKLKSLLKLGKHKVAVDPPSSTTKQEDNTNKNIMEKNKVKSDKSTSNWKPEVYVNYLTTR
ncbi:unnamed protein product [Cunninghamella echinulata]